MKNRKNIKKYGSEGEDGGKPHDNAGETPGESPTTPQGKPQLHWLILLIFNNP